MKSYRPVPKASISAFVEDILVIENDHVQVPFTLPLFANGKPTLLFQTVKGRIGNDANYLTLFGQTVLPTEISFPENFTLIAYFFKPFALSALFGFIARELTDKPINLNLLEPQKASELQEQLLHASSAAEMIGFLNDFIFFHIAPIKTDPAAIRFATQLLAANPSTTILSKIQDELCMTERTFQRMFEQKVGISPNQYRRVAQFNAAFEQLNKREFRLFSDIAFRHGYADQSHFIRAFKEFTHLTPKQYLNFGEPE